MGLTPSYEQKAFSVDQRRNRLTLVASRDAAEDSLTINSDVRIYLSDLIAGHTIQHGLTAGRHAWLQVLRGSVSVNDVALVVSDGVAISDETSITIQAMGDAEVMLFDLP